MKKKMPLMTNLCTIEIADALGHLRGHFDFGRTRAYYVCTDVCNTEKNLR